MLLLNAKYLKGLWINKNYLFCSVLNDMTGE
jgi:hypothetical protein